MARDTGTASAYLVYSDDDHHGRTFRVETGRVRIGRGAGVELRLGWDREASRVHAELERVADGWMLRDDGLSANGTFVNGEQLRGRRRLASGDRIRVGQTDLVFRSTSDDGSLTFIPELSGPPVELSRMQRRVLLELARPYAGGAKHAVPATNQQIGDALYVSVDAVKTHLRVLFSKFEIAGLPQNMKRARLVELAFERGNVTENDLI